MLCTFNTQSPLVASYSQTKHDTPFPLHQDTFTTNPITRLSFSRKSSKISVLTPWHPKGKSHKLGQAVLRPREHTVNFKGKNNQKKQGGGWRGHAAANHRKPV